MVLVGKGLGTLIKYRHHHNVGRLIGPRDCGRVADTPREGFLWAADNDAFNGFDEKRWHAMLEKCEGVPGCLFAACPDAVGDADETFRLYLKHSRRILTRRLPLGYVAQDGATPEKVPWGGVSALFVGGTTQWKLGREARVLVDAARERGLWVHMGRVNGDSRTDYARDIGCDSIDGTSVSMFTDTHLPRRAWKAGTPRLFDGVAS